MSGVFRNIDPPPPHRPASVYYVVYPPSLLRGEDTLAGWRGGGGSTIRKTPDTALLYICKYFVAACVYLGGGEGVAGGGIKNKILALQDCACV